MNQVFYVAEEVAKISPYFHSPGSNSLAMIRIFGKYIAETARPYILSECFVLAKESTKSF